MSLDTISGIDTPNRVKHQTEIECDTINDQIHTLLGTKIHIFSPETDIFHSGLQQLFKEGRIFIDPNLKSGYYSILTQGGSKDTGTYEKGTGFALVSEEYLQKRGTIQGVLATKNAIRVGEATIGNDGRKTCIYFVGSYNSINSGTYNSEQLEAALQELKSLTF